MTPPVPGGWLLGLAGLLVPLERRAEWRREWQAELAAMQTLGSRWVSPKAYWRCLGAFEDAIWIRVRQRSTSMLRHDVRTAFRGLYRNPVFTIVAVLTLALGIGANTAVFTLVDAVLLRPLPVDRPDALVDLYTSCRRGFLYCSTSYPDYVDYRDRNRSFSDVAAFTGMRLLVDRGAGGDYGLGMLVSGNYFATLGVGPVRGRVLQAVDDRLDEPSAVAVLSYRAWATDYGADDDVLGTTIRVNGVPVTVVGVASEGFRGTRLSSAPDLFLPITALTLLETGTDSPGERLDDRGSRWIGGVIGRLREGVELAAARTDMLSVSAQLQEEDPDSRGSRTITVERVRTATLPASDADTIVRFVAILMAVVATGLLIACANLANLLLARAHARRREIGVRLSLGATRGQLVTQLLTESILLAGIGALAGVGIAAAGLRVMNDFALPGFVPIDRLDLRLDARVFLFTAVAAIATGIVFGLVPALQATRQSLTDALKDRAGDGVGSLKTRNVLLALQTALAFVLLAGAGLFIKSLQNGLDSDVGYERRNMALASIDLGLARYDEPATVQFLRRFSEEAAGVPGAAAVSMSYHPPLALYGSGYFAEPDVYTPAEDEEIRIEANYVGPEYFGALGIPLLNGRDFTLRDAEGQPFVTVISRTMGERYWAGMDPVGHHVRVAGIDYLIVGYAEEVKAGLTGQAEPFMYFPMLQHPARVVAGGDITVIVATGPDAGNALASVSGVIRRIDSDLAVRGLSTFHDRLADYLLPQRMGSLLLSTLGGLTVLLAAVGVFGVVAFVVGLRRREIGIRLALGGAESRVRWRMMAMVLAPVGAGVAVGLVGAVGLTRFIANFLYDVRPTDLGTFAVVTGVMIVVAVAAAYLPARRVSGVGPAEALRAE